jgi:glycosyltransferase involved in cell wall biosynthesis
MLARLRALTGRRPRLRIATVYLPLLYGRFEPSAMDTVRWLRISEALASLGFAVDMIIDIRRRLPARHPNLRAVPLSRVDWDGYDVIETLFHRGFDTLERGGGADHPCIIAELGSVVGPTDESEGVHFFGKYRSALYDTQRRIAERSRYVAVLTEESRALWRRHLPSRNELLLVPTGVDRRIPRPGRNPYAGFSERIAVYLGNIYSGDQKSINLLWQEKLNEIGRALHKRGIRLCFVGTGDTELIDKDAVTCLGHVDNVRSWDYQRFAHVGIALAQGPVQHNESSKIYYYLRTGLPVVAEDPIPNSSLIHEAGLGFTVGYGQHQTMAEMIEAAAARTWDRERAIRYVLAHHTWEDRARTYARLIRPV